jgi:hypothetical protein
MVRDIVEMTITNELNPTVRKRLAEIVQLLQVYARLAELEIAAGERAGVGDVVLPEDTTKEVRGWTEGEGAKISEREELSEAMRTREHDAGALKAVGE